VEHSIVCKIKSIIGESQDSVPTYTLALKTYFYAYQYAILANLRLDVAFDSSSLLLFALILYSSHIYKVETKEGI